MTSSHTHHSAAPLETSLLSELGAVIWGEHWQSPMARDLGVALRTVQRWAAGRYEPPPTVYARLREWLMVRSITINMLLQRMGVDNQEDRASNAFERREADR